MNTQLPFLTAILAFVLSLSSTCSAEANECGELLAGGVFNTFLTSRTAHSEAKAHKALCEGQVIEKSGQSSNGGRGGFSIGIADDLEIGLFGSGESAKSFQDVEEQYHRRPGPGPSSALRSSHVRQRRIRAVNPSAIA